LNSLLFSNLFFFLNDITKNINIISAIKNSVNDMLIKKDNGINDKIIVVKILINFSDFIF
jgi:hypothetical protein